MFAGIHWKKKKGSIKFLNVNQNVMTLNQTVFLVSLLHLDNSLLAYFLGSQNTAVFTMEMWRTILIENIFFKFIIPVFLIIYSKLHLKSLWSDQDYRNINFFLSSSSYEARPVVSKYSNKFQIINEKDTSGSSNSASKYRDLTVTVHGSIDSEGLPEIA